MSTITTKSREIYYSLSELTTHFQPLLKNTDHFSHCKKNCLEGMRSLVGRFQDILEIDNLLDAPGPDTFKGYKEILVEEEHNRYYHEGLEKLEKVKGIYFDETVRIRMAQDYRMRRIWRTCMEVCDNLACDGIAFIKSNPSFLNKHIFTLPKENNSSYPFFLHFLRLIHPTLLTHVTQQ